ncbi:MAG: hypothetical protein M1819_004172 [Sarea resinae]|nr:MAG: hypothetical protein M1819_004172 [Sarea resinae]
MVFLSYSIIAYQGGTITVTSLLAAQLVINAILFHSQMNELNATRRRERALITNPEQTDSMEPNGGQSLASETLPDSKSKVGPSKIGKQNDANLMAERELKADSKVEKQSRHLESGNEMKAANSGEIFPETLDTAAKTKECGVNRVRANKGWSKGAVPERDVSKGGRAPIAEYQAVSEVVASTVKTKDLREDPKVDTQVLSKGGHTVATGDQTKAELLLPPKTIKDRNRNINNLRVDIAAKGDSLATNTGKKVNSDFQNSAPTEDHVMGLGKKVKDELVTLTKAQTERSGYIPRAPLTAVPRLASRGGPEQNQDKSKIGLAEMLNLDPEEVNAEIAAESGHLQATKDPGDQDGDTTLDQAQATASASSDSTAHGKPGGRSGNKATKSLSKSKPKYAADDLDALVSEQLYHKNKIEPVTKKDNMEANMSMDTPVAVAGPKPRQALNQGSKADKDETKATNETKDSNKHDKTVKDTKALGATAPLGKGTAAAKDYPKNPKKQTNLLDDEDDVKASGQGMKGLKQDGAASEQENKALRKDQEASQQENKGQKTFEKAFGFKTGKHKPSKGKSGDSKVSGPNASELKSTQTSHNLVEGKLNERSPTQKDVKKGKGKGRAQVKKVETDAQKEAREQKKDTDDYIQAKNRELRERLNVSRTKWIYGDLTIPHPNHHRSWSSRNLWCATCLGQCELCRRPCCVYLEQSLILLDGNKTEAEKIRADDLLREIRLWNPIGLDEDVFLKCTDCKKRCCTECAGICPTAICQDQQCKGKLYVRGDSKIFRFQNGKTESLFLQRKNPRRISWTTLYRRQHKKGISEEVAKKRTRRTVKSQRAIVGASLDVIKERRAQRPEARAAARQAAIKEGKERKTTLESKKKMEKAKGAAGAARGQTARIQSKQGAKGKPVKPAATSR